MLAPLVFLGLGILCGRFWFSAQALGYVDTWIMASLAVVVLAAGIDIGAKKIIFNSLARYRAKILFIPLGTVIGSLLGGVLLGYVLKLPLNEAASVSAGFAYYSLSAGMLAELGGASLGALAFISNILRELLALLLIPVLARLDPYFAVAAGGATTMDTTLGVIARGTSEEITVIAMLNGIVLSALVPVLVPFLYSL